VILWLARWVIIVYTKSLYARNSYDLRNDAKELALLDLAFLHAASQIRCPGVLVYWATGYCFAAVQVIVALF
jgi:hypothetical protein